MKVLLQIAILCCFSLLPTIGKTEQFNSLSMAADRGYASWQCAHLARHSVTRDDMFDAFFEQGLAIFSDVITDSNFSSFMKENPKHAPLRVLIGSVKNQDTQFKLGYLWAVTIDVTNLKIDQAQSGDTDEAKDRRRALLAEQSFLTANCPLVLVDE